jgi:hypothetical protein
VEPARSIDRLGFRRWYERQLLEAHAWLVSCLLCGFTIVALAEGLDFRHDPAQFIMRSALILALGFVCWISLHRYSTTMLLASRLAEHATCSACGAYAAFRVTNESPRIHVHCRKCDHEWLL